MSDYIIHNIGLTVSPQLDLFQLLDPDKPVAKYPNYYLVYTKGTVPFVYIISPDFSELSAKVQINFGFTSGKWVKT